MSTVQFHVPGEPCAKGRAKVSTFNGRIQLRTPAKTVRYESTVALFARQAMGARALLDGPVSLSVCAVFQAPKSWSKKRLAANAIKPEFVVKRPDLDNLVKALCDGMNGVVWIDDSQVGSMDCKKVYGTTPGVLVAVEALS